MIVPLLLRRDLIHTSKTIPYSHLMLLDDEDFLL
jgi:hypothetical protein